MKKFLGITITHGKILSSLSILKRGKVSIDKLREGEIDTSSDSHIVRDLRKFVRENRLKAGDVTFGIPEEEVTIKIGTYPKMPREDLRKILLDEISSYKIFENDYPVLNIVKLGEENGRERILLVSIPRKRVVRWINIIRKAGLGLSRIELNPVSCFRAIKFLNKKNLTGSGALVFLNTFKTTLIFFKDEDILFLREFDIGIENMEGNEEQWINEVSNTISYYSRAEKKIVEKMLISGVEKIPEKLLSSLSDKLGIRIENEDQIKGVPIHLLAPIGLSLSRLGDRVNINLIPRDIIERPKDELKTFFLGLFIFIVGVLIISLSTYLINSQKTTDMAIRGTKDNLKRIERSLEDLKGVEKEYKRLSDELKKLKDVTGEFESIKLSLISKIDSLKGDVVIVGISMDKENHINLNVVGNRFQSIFSYRKRLIESGYFSDVRIGRMEKRGGKGVASTIEIEIKGEKGD